MRLTDEQVREIKKLLDGHAPPRATYLNQMSDLLADREALLVEFAVIKTHAAERIAARDAQIENGAKMIAKLLAENLKLRRVVEAVKSQTVDDLLSGPVVRHNNTHQDGWDCSLCSALYALDAKDATDDKG